ncbi:MAG TPA: DUF5996 family protein [Candidatus Angelobacter sp.]|nr:DUF5996 family protein [Candidatus Angelobacter sp.]
MNAVSKTVSDAPECWPELHLDSWKDTCATLHMWTQIVGKVRLALSPPVNHWWNVTLYVSSRGLTTSPMPYGARAFEIEFDFIDHQLVIRVSDGAAKTIKLAPKSVADFYRELMATLRDLALEVKIWKMPVEIADPIPFDQDRQHASYDAVAVGKFWKILLSTDAVFKQFRSGFVGKSSPVHFFWGSFDLAVTRFSGRRAPARNDPDPVLRKIMREAYSHEVISAGLWPGSGDVKDMAYYCYAAPEPQGFSKQKVRPAAASYAQGLGEFLLMYDDIRRSSSPSAALLEFLQSTYEAGATAGHWDREELEAPLEPVSGAA